MSQTFKIITIILLGLISISVFLIFGYCASGTCLSGLHISNTNVSSGLISDAIFLLTDASVYVFIIILVLFLAMWLLVKEKYKKMFWFLGTVIFSLIAEIFVKEYLQINRPESHFVNAFSYSYPSGHATMSAIIAILYYRHLISNLVGYFRRKILTIIAILFPILVGLGRMYLGMHWLGDILGGFALAISVACFAYFLERFFTKHQN